MRQWIGLALVQKKACRLFQTNAGLLPIGSSRTNLSEILINIQNFPFTKKHLKISSAKWQPFYPGGDELMVGMSWPDMPHNRNLRSFKRLLQTITDYSIDSMMTTSNGNIFRVTGHLCGEFTGPRWIPHTKASDAELWCLLWSAPE